MKIVWMSFSDEEFRGVVIVKVTDEEVKLAELELQIWAPRHLEGAEIVAAAIRKSHQLGCNPGGQVLSSIFPEGAQVNPFPEDCFNRLLSKAEIIERGLGELHESE